MQGTTADPRILALGSELAAPSRTRASLVLAGAATAGAATYALSCGPGVGLAFSVLDALFVAGWLAVFRARVTRLGWAWSAAALWAGGAYVVHASDWTAAIAPPTAMALVATLPVVLRERMRFGDLGGLLGRSTAALRATPSAARSAASLPRAALDGRWDTARGIVRGLAIGVPLSGVFVLLLSADPAFGSLVARIAETWRRTVSATMWSSILAAIHLVAHEVHTRAEPRRSIDRPDGAPYRADAARVWVRRPAGPRLRTTTWIVVVAQLVAVFGAFVGANLGYLFGGDGLVRGRSSLTYAEYLHAGFAQLSLATFLAVLVVVVGHLLLRDRSAPAASIPGGRAATLLEVALLALTGITLASCQQRLVIYEQAYGYTHLRLGVTFFQLAVLGLLGLTAAKSIARGWKGWGAGVVAGSVLVALAAASVDADSFVARHNLDRAAAGAALDIGYLASLSDDARPLLAHTALAKDPAAVSWVRQRWDERRAEIRAGGWRAFRGIAGRH